MQELSALTEQNIRVVAVGIGSHQSAVKFAEMTGFPKENLYADPSGECYTALGYEKGLAPDVPASPYVKLLLMCAGIGSPGTLKEVFRGYTGYVRSPYRLGPFNMP